MKRNLSIAQCAGLLCAAFFAAMLAGCSSSHKPSATTLPDISPATMSVANPPTPVASALPTIRIKSGSDADFKDSQGVVWSADTGYDGGETNDRTDLDIVDTDRPELFRAERYGMNSYTFKVPNGAYNLKLYFSEDYDGITAPTDRIFTYDVKDGDPASGKTVKDVKDFSPWKAAGAEFKGYIDTVPVDVTSGQISITFTPQVENPQINAIEIVPR